MPPIYRVELSPSNRATCVNTECKKAGVRLMKGELRMGTQIEIKEKQSWTWKHWGCVTPYQLTQWHEVTDGDMELVDGLEELPEELQEKVIKAIDQGHVDDEDWKGDAAMNRDGNKKFRAPQSKKRKAAEEDGGESEPELPDSPVKKKTAAKKAPAKKAQLDGESPPAKKPAAKKGRTKKEDDDQVADPPVKKGRGRPRKPVPMESESEIDDGDESEPTPPPKKKRAPAKKKAAEVEVNNDDEDEDVAPKAKPAGKKKAGGAKKAAAPKKAAAKGRKKAPVSEEIVHDDDANDSDV